LCSFVVGESSGFFGAETTKIEGFSVYGDCRFPWSRPWLMGDPFELRNTPNRFSAVPRGKWFSLVEILLLIDGPKAGNFYRYFFASIIGVLPAIPLPAQFERFGDSALRRTRQ
jgi:hypothetical protein